MNNPINKTDKRFQAYLRSFNRRLINEKQDFSAVKEIIRIHRMMEAADILQNAEDYRLYELCMEYIDQFLSNQAKGRYQFSSN